MAKYNKKKRVSKVVNTARVYVTATFNNTIINITDTNGDSVAWSSTGAAGFKGSRKSTSYAATVAAEGAIGKALDRGMKQAEVFIKGPGPGRDVALRILRAKGIEITQIADLTPVPHNGTRPRKQ
ncbi:MAG TPA: 30S ribosomal protein S11 [Candidatus Woesebacteria bacterium]|mgnify:CR=1 FL=1|nr:30S ribosomal protein S11 [Candidatus Woesebacteria bacterium]